MIEEIPYDLVIVDEAHHLRNAHTVLWQFVDRRRRTYLPLLTANDLDELFSELPPDSPEQAALGSKRLAHVSLFGRQVHA